MVKSYWCAKLALSLEMKNEVGISIGFLPLTYPKARPFV
jgi:hypothetical protein